MAWTRSRLRVPSSTIEQPSTYVIDAHNHLSDEFGAGWFRRDPSDLAEAMDMVGVATFIDLDGAWSHDVLTQRLSIFKPALGPRYQVTTGIRWDRWEIDGDAFGPRAADALEHDIDDGAIGLKVWKDLGLHVKRPDGTLATVDDRELSPIWDRAADLDVPVIVHTADPVAFWDPIDEANERRGELAMHPEWSYASDHFPSFETLMEQFERLIRANSRTQFVGAHVAGNAEDLAWVSTMLDRYDNLSVDIAARIGELGRQPRMSAKLFETYSDRIVFGVDHPSFSTGYSTYYRFLETDDEYFEYADAPHQGEWRIYGLGLEEDVLEAVYHGNAQRIFGLDRTDE